MKKFFLIITSLLLVADKTFSMECTSKILKTLNVHNLPGAGYWIQPFGNCRITYTSVGGLRSKLFNYCKNQLEVISDDLDAFPIPGEGELYLHPGDGLRFLKLKDINESNFHHAIPFFKDPLLDGNYESVGVLKESTPQNRIIRVVMGNTGGLFRDYRIDKDGDKYHVKPIQDKVVPMCKNLPEGGLEKELPILSRNGMMVAGRAYDSRKSEIFKLDSLGNCTRIQTTPLSTSKVVFTFDNQNVLYVITDPHTNKGRLIEMNIKTGVTTTLSGPDEDVMYMTAREDGTILYTRRGLDTPRPQDEVMKNESADKTGSDLVELDPKLFDVREPKKFEAIGLMWGDACDKDLDLDFALAVGERFDEKRCQELITDEAVRNLDVDHKFSKDELMTLCHSNAGTRLDESRTSGTSR